MKTSIKTTVFFYFITIFVNTAWSQSAFDTFFKPSDTLNISRRNAVIISKAALFVGGIIQMNKPFDQDYQNSKFHFIHDNSRYLQMDKSAHVFASYQIGSASFNALQWSGVSKKNQLLFGAGMGFVFLTSVEFIDGCANGTSYGDIIGNAVGTSLFVTQELLWKEQRIVPKFSFHSTDFFSATPRIMRSKIENEFDGQTYWLSFNLHSFFKGNTLPKWLNCAVGYGVEGVNKDKDITADAYRQLYFSLDADLTKIKTKSHFLKTVFYVFNTIKIPAPALEFRSRGRVKGHLVYF